MAYNPQKRPMSLQDFLYETYEPAWRFEESADYVIYHDDYYSGLSILIDRDAYYTVRNNTIRYFDMLRLHYVHPLLPDKVTIRYGNYFTSEEYGPSFFLTEPKHASHVIIYNSTPVRSYERNKKRAKVASINSWIHTKESNGHMHEIANAQCQEAFEKALACFYWVKP